MSGARVTWLARALAVTAVLLACDEATPPAGRGADLAAGASGAAGASAPVDDAAAGNGAGGAASGGAGAVSHAGAGPAAGGSQAAAAGAEAGIAGLAGSAGSAGTGEEVAGAGGALPAPVLPPVTSTDAAGPFATEQDLASGPRGQSGVFRPAVLGEAGLRHPIFVWGCGGGSTPAAYADHLSRIASHGFVVIAEVSTIGDDGATLLAALDWLTEESERAESDFYQRLDTARVGLGGHSIGSVNAFRVADDPRWTTTVHVAGGSLDDVNDPFAQTSGLGGQGLIHPAAYVCAETDSFGNTEKTEQDYANTSVPVFFTVIDGADHVDAARQGLPAIVAWLRWQLGGERARSAAFLDPQGEFCTGKFVSRSKNW